jgi:hypothetical protein
MLSDERARSDAIQHRKRASLVWMLRHAQVWVCLLGLLVQLILPVIHLWDMPREALSAARLAWQGRSAAQDMTAHLTVSEHGMEAGCHEMLLCPICQTLARAHAQWTPSRVGFVLPQVHDPLLLLGRAAPCTLQTTVCAPRAPPFAA